MSDPKPLEVSQTEIECIIGAADEIRRHAIQQASRLDEALQRLSPEPGADGDETTGIDRPEGALARLRAEHGELSEVLGEIEVSITRLCRLV